MPHRIEVFSGGCSLCEQTAEIVEVGKCKDCTMQTLDVNDPGNGELIRKYSIAAVPSIVIDGKIKVVGVPDFPWFCGDEFYKKLEREFPVKRAEKRRPRLGNLRDVGRASRPARS